MSDTTPVDLRGLQLPKIPPSMRWYSSIGITNADLRKLPPTASLLTPDNLGLTTVNQPNLPTEKLLKLHLLAHAAIRAYLRSGGKLTEEDYVTYLPASAIQELSFDQPDIGLLLKQRLRDVPVEILKELTEAAYPVWFDIDMLYGDDNSAPEMRLVIDQLRLQTHSWIHKIKRLVDTHYDKRHIQATLVLRSSRNHT